MNTQTNPHLNEGDVYPKIIILEWKVSNLKNPPIIPVAFTPEYTPPPPRGWTVNNNSLIISKLDRCKYLSKIIQMHHREKKHNHTNNSNNNNNNE